MNWKELKKDLVNYIKESWRGIIIFIIILVAAVLIGWWGYASFIRFITSS